MESASQYNGSLTQGVLGVTTPSPTNNSTTVPTSTMNPAVRVISGVLLCLIIIFTLVGNALVVMAVANFQRLRSVTNYFVVSLAVADLTVAILVMPYSLLYVVYDQWTFGWEFCYFWISCDVMCCTASILHLCVISLDRYVAITQPLSYKTKLSKRRTFLMIGGVWLCSGAISFVPVFTGLFAHDDVILYKDSTECGLKVNRTYAVISSSTSFYVPLIVMAIVYLKIFRIARRQAREIKHLEQQVAKCEQMMEDGTRLQKRSKNVRRDAKAIKTLGTLMGLFCVSWLPFFLMYVIMPFCEQCEAYLPVIVQHAITWLGYANSFINPCVYAFHNRDFRQAFKKILLCGRTRFCCCEGIQWRKQKKEREPPRRDMPSGLYEYVLTDAHEHGNVVANGNGVLRSLHSKPSGSTVASFQLDKVVI